MPLKSSYGFLTPQATTHDAAHELGHGKFNLRHTFSPHNPIILKEGTTQNLMDYSTGAELLKYQWDLIHNPQGGWFVFEDVEEGASPWFTTHLSDISRILGNIRCSFVEKRPFSFPKPTGISSGHLSANFPLGTNEIPVTVSISNDILDFVPTVISYDADGNDARFHFPNFVVKTDTQNAEALRSYLNGTTTTSEADQEATQRLESLLQANKPSDALDELYRLPTCLVCTFSAETRLQLLSAIASETVSDDSRDNAAIDLMRCFVDKSQGDVLFKAFEENHQFINALFNRVQDDYTQDVFIALFLEAYTQRYSTDEPQVQPNSYYVANRTITGVYLGSNRLNGPPYTITLRQLDTRVGHYTNVQRYNPCDVVGMVIPAIESSSQDQIIYLPALYLYSVLQQKAQQDLVDFLVGAAQVAGIFSGTSLFISGVSTFQKVMGCVEALNAATNVVLETDAVRTQLLATEYGQDFLDSWGTISTAVDLATVGAALATFRRTAPQVLDEIDNFVPEGSLGIQNIRRVSGAVSVFKAGDNIAGKTIVQVRLGTNGKVAVIGRQMDDHVKNIAAHLKNNQGLQVEILDDGYLNRTFDIDGVEWTVNSAWDDMKKNPLYKDMKDPITGHIKAEYIEQIPMYKLNKQWVEYIQLEGFTIIDIGYPQGVTSESLFYNMEISTINW